MHKYQNKFHLLFYTIFTLTAVLILVDFISPGRIINDEIINVQRERQQYYNAARNYHYSHKITTSEHNFLVTEDFVELELLNKKIEYSVSRIFKEVNWYRLRSSEKKSIYSLRIASGLVLPLLAIISIFMAFWYKKKIATLNFILQILLMADLIFLMR